MTRHRFDGQIAGVGSVSGVRVVVGRWVSSPWGPFADAMVETATGHRVLVAPSEQVRDYLATTYRFDETRVEPFLVELGPQRWQVESDSLQLDLQLGRRTAPGWALRVLPRSVATSPAWCAVTDPLARVLLGGVRTRGTANGHRREWYGATDVRAVDRAQGSFDGADLGELAPVDPPCAFGFSSTPTTPSVTTLVTTVDAPGG